MDRKEILYTLTHLKKMEYLNFSFSQEGEDLILNRMFEKTENGFYIDIGAYHPIKFSNTFLLYRRGWNGINIDARPGSMKVFDKLRKRDINIEAALSSNDGDKLTYYEFGEGALNTFDKNLAFQRQELGYNIKKEIVLQTYNIMSLLDKYVKPSQKIDIIDIDIEGFDEFIIESIDWEKYRPTVILTEKTYQSDDGAYKKLTDNGYIVVACTGSNIIYKDKETMK